MLGPCGLSLGRKGPKPKHGHLAWPLTKLSPRQGRSPSSPSSVFLLHTHFSMTSLSCCTSLNPVLWIGSTPGERLCPHPREQQSSAGHAESTDSQTNGYQTWESKEGLGHRVGQEAFHRSAGWKAVRGRGAKRATETATVRLGGGERGSQRKVSPPPNSGSPSGLSSFSSITPPAERRGCRRLSPGN